MKKVSLLLALLLLAATGVSAAVTSNEYDCASLASPAQPAVKQSSTNATQENANGRFQREVKQNPTLITEFESPAQPLRSSSRVKSVTSISDLTGYYVMTFATLVSDGYDGGVGVYVSPIEGTDSILITDFWDIGYTATAKVDISTMTITFPSQVVAVSSSYGNITLAVATSSGSYDTTQSITGTINEDGTFTIDSWWGLFCKWYDDSDELVDGYYGLYYNTLFETTNAMMSYTMWNSSTSSYDTYTFGVIAEQTSTNILSVKNFADYGWTVKIELKRDSTAKIASQTVLTNGYGSWYTYATTYDTSMNLTAYEGNIICDKATDLRTISWGNWSFICSSFYYGAITSGTITLTSDISYPAPLSSTEFDGSGTESSPYLIKTLDDLCLLADNVNNSTDLDYQTSDGTSFARVYLGQYFRLENDIDMSGYRFTPIGADVYHVFAGTFDGNGKTLTGLSVATGTDLYAGLFGKCDTLSVIKSLTLVDPEVETNTYYAGAIAGYSLGTIEDCTVTGATVSIGLGMGGIAGYGYTITGCTVSDSYIVGGGGFCGGISGQINVAISNCAVINTIIQAGSVSSTTPSGGVVGSLYYGNMSNCYFSGSLDGTSVSYLNLGGVAGVCYYGTIDQCFSTGYIEASGSSAIVGGIVGTLYGYLSNCYSNGYITNSSSAYVGGLTGLVYITSVVKDSYTSCYITAGTSAYETETGAGELLGTIDSSASPSISNIYYDSKMTDFGSVSCGLTTSEMTTASGLSGFDSSIWTFADGVYPRLTAFASTESAALSASTFVMDDGVTFDRFTKNTPFTMLGATQIGFSVNGEFSKTGYYASIVGDSIILGDDFGLDTIYIYNATAGSRTYAISVMPMPFDGEGIEASPYLIKTKADLISLSEITTTMLYQLEGFYFYMTNDIDLEQDTAYLGISSTKQFLGSFDGGGHTVHNMVLPASVVWTTAPADDSEGLGTPNTSSCTSYRGFMGRLGSSGTLKNIAIAADCDITGHWYYVGALVGYNSSGTIDSCYNYADVQAYSDYVGGITGFNTGTISNSYNAGSVTGGYRYVGGISGGSYGDYYNCQNVGPVAAKISSRYQTTASNMRYVGGIVGSMSISGEVSNCVNSATITAYSHVGGLVGSLSGTSTTNSLINSISYGTVVYSIDDATSCGVIGGNPGSKYGTISGVYYDGQITSLGAVNNAILSGVTGTTTSTLISGTALDGFSTDIWDFTAGYYPVLKLFADEDLAKISRAVIAKVADDETVADLHSNVELSTENDCAWTLADGTSFTISDGRLVPPSTVTVGVYDTLTATVGTFVKPIYIASLPEVPLTGSGTADSPYLINDTTDWNTLADFMSGYSTSLSGKYVKIVNDLDFTGVTLKPLAYNRSTEFDGYLDGNSKTIKGFTSVADSIGYGAIIYATGIDAYVHDLTVEGTLTSDYNYVGGVFYSLSGTAENITSRVAVTSSGSNTAGLACAVGEDAILTNCVNEGDVTSTSGNHTAGLACTVGANSVLTNCGNTGDITSTSTGVAGVAYYSYQNVTYTNCYNSGNVYTTSTTALTYAAGMISYAYYCTMTDCYNTGSVTTSNTTAGIAAGIIACPYGASATDGLYFTLTGCYNTGDITAACGVAGITSNGSNSYAHFIMESCYNTGNITATATSTKSYYTAGVATAFFRYSTYRNCWNSGTVTSNKPNYAGGVFGYYKGTGSATATTTIVNCYNTGTVTGAGSYTGGVFGCIYYYVYVDSCWNSGTVNGASYVGGVAGRLYGNTNAKLTNSYNTGAVTATASYAGGLAGQSYTKDSVDCCFNTGAISAPTSFAGGLAGQGAAVFTNCYNAGAVSGGTQVGGLLGAGRAGSYTELYNSYNMGTVTATGSNYGNILGHGTDNTTYWKSGNYMSGTYYLSANALECTDTASVGLTYAELAKLDLGESWNYGDDYSYPRLYTVDNDYAKAYAAAVIPADGDSYSSITGKFNIGRPDDVVWTASSTSVEIDDNVAYFTESYTGTLTMTATCGEASVSTELTCVATTTGIQDIGNDSGRTVVDETFYTPSGAQVAQPDNNAKAIYIVVRTYDDGTTEVVKEAR